jgi:hypothetical protein
MAREASAFRNGRNCFRYQRRRSAFSGRRSDRRRVLSNIASVQHSPLCRLAARLAEAMLCISRDATTWTKIGGHPAIHGRVLFARPKAFDNHKHRHNLTFISP